MNTTINYQEKNDNLLKEWKDQCLKDGFEKFCDDGLMFKGEIKTTHSNNGSLCYYRNPGDEGRLWGCAPKRVMFLNKDVPNEENEDLRARIFRQNPTIISSLIYKNISLWLYGLLNVNKDAIPPDFDAINDTLLLTPFIDKTPIAYVNCKKESGYSSISNEVLNDHIERYDNYLTEQILILDPDIIVCGGGSSSIKNFIARKVYPNIIEVNTWMFYDKGNNKLVIDSFHPSYFGFTQKEFYLRMMEKYREFLIQFPEFLNSCRNFKCTDS